MKTASEMDLDRRIEADILSVVGQVGVIPGSGVHSLVVGNAQRIHLALRRLESAGRLVYVYGHLRGWTLP
jgi:hypothetical protein